jgi:hypothetical protein
MTKVRRAVGKAVRAAATPAVAVLNTGSSLGEVAYRLERSTFNREPINPAKLDDSIMLLEATGDVATLVAPAAVLEGELPTLQSPRTEKLPTLMRGTSAGFAGGPVAVTHGIASTTFDPLVATLFATRAETEFGNGVVHIATGADLRGATVGVGNVLHELEAEIALNMQPTEFAKRASLTISAQRARTILREMVFRRRREFRKNSSMVPSRMQGLLA